MFGIHVGSELTPIEGIDCQLALVGFGSKRYAKVVYILQVALSRREQVV